MCGWTGSAYVDRPAPQLSFGLWRVPHHSSPLVCGHPLASRSPRDVRAPTASQPQISALDQPPELTPGQLRQSTLGHESRYITVSEGQSLIRIAHANHVSAKAIGCRQSFGAALPTKDWFPTADAWRRCPRSRPAYSCSTWNGICGRHCYCSRNPKITKTLTGFDRSTASLGTACRFSSAASAPHMVRPKRSASGSSSSRRRLRCCSTVRPRMVGPSRHQRSW
jgi:hypothetical protein